MSKLVDPQRLVAVRKLTSELRALQDRLNLTIDQLCDLLTGVEASDVLSSSVPISSSTGGSPQRELVPVFLSLPKASVYKNNPPSGYALSPECRMFSDYKTAALQVIQAPSTRGAEGRYALLMNYADFDGSFLSLVLDARALLSDLPPGRARLGLVLDVRGIPQLPLHAKCAWRMGDQWAEQRLDAKADRLIIDTFELPTSDLSTIQALDFHFIFSPHSRGTIEIHRLSITLVMDDAPTAAPAAANIFESVGAP